MCQGIGNALRDSKEFGGTRAEIGVGRQGAGRGLGDEAEAEPHVWSVSLKVTPVGSGREWPDWVFSVRL